MTDLPSEVDVAIVGGGPAGLSAAAELRRLGVARVLVLDRDTEAGGVPRICGHSPYGLREFGRPMLGPAYARALASRARGAGAQVAPGAMVTAIAPGPRLTVTTDNGVQEVAARAVLLATGTRETPRAARLIGGTKPGGVMVTGALQTLVYGAGMRPFRAPVVLGTELVAFSALLTCRHAGIRPVAMVEPGARITARHPAQLLPRALGIPLHLCSTVAAVEGRDRVEAILLDTPTGPRRIETDGLIVSGRFRPEATLARLAGVALDPLTGGPAVDEGGRCDLPGLYAAGNLLRPVETAGACWSEGRRVARSIARDLATSRLEAAIPIALHGSALKYVMPQRVTGTPGAAFDRLQIRVARPARGRLSLRIDGHEIAGRDLSALPERRLTLPLPPARPGLSVQFEETT